MDEWIFLKGPNPADVDVALSRIPSTFGKLVFLARLIDSVKGATAERTTAVCEDGVDVSLKRKHHDLTLRWLHLVLATQTEEVAQYFASEGGGRNSRIIELLDQWIQEKKFERLVPDGVSEQVRSLFCSDLQAILRLLRLRLGVIESKPRC
jgi:hypothetical protein